MLERDVDLSKDSQFNRNPGLRVILMKNVLEISDFYPSCLSP